MTWFALLETGSCDQEPFSHATLFDVVSCQGCCFYRRQIESVEVMKSIAPLVRENRFRGMRAHDEEMVEAHSAMTRNTIKCLNRKCLVL